MPVTQIVSVTAGAVAAGWLVARGASWRQAGAVFAASFIFFQFFPISPGSVCRGVYVLYLMIKERNLRDYIIAAPVSFVKYIGYLAFPLQMTTKYPGLAQFLAGRWATSATHVIPVFGEKGALLEHWVFDLCFNLPQALQRLARPHVKELLTIWLFLGGLLCAGAFYVWEPAALGVAGVNLLLATVCLFVLPRLLFLPLLSRSRPGVRRNGSDRSAGDR